MLSNIKQHLEDFPPDLPLVAAENAILQELLSALQTKGILRPHDFARAAETCSDFLRQNKLHFVQERSKIPDTETETSPDETETEPILGDDIRVKSILRFENNWNNDFEEPEFLK